MNVRDSEVVAGLLKQEGYSLPDVISHTLPFCIIYYLTTIFFDVKIYKIIYYRIILNK
jgi:hypothetical protein